MWQNQTGSVIFPTYNEKDSIGQPVKEGLFIIDFGTRRMMDQKIIWRSQEISIRELLTRLEDTGPIINILYLRDDFLARALQPNFKYNQTLEYLKIYDLRKLK